MLCRKLLRGGVNMENNLEALNDYFEFTSCSECGFSDLCDKYSKIIDIEDEEMWGNLCSVIYNMNEHLSKSAY